MSFALVVYLAHDKSEFSTLSHKGEADGTLHSLLAPRSGAGTETSRRYGAIHSRMPTIVSIKVGDVVFPVTLIKKKLYVMARLPVTHRECAFDYCMRELGREYGALTPEGIVIKKTDTFYWAKGQSCNCAEAIPDGMTLMIES